MERQGLSHGGAPSPHTVGPPEVRTGGEARIKLGGHWSQLAMRQINTDTPRPGSASLSMARYEQKQESNNTRIKCYENRHHFLHPPLTFYISSPSQEETESDLKGKSVPLLTLLIQTV